MLVQGGHAYELVKNTCKNRVIIKKDSVKTSTPFTSNFELIVWVFTPTQFTSKNVNCLNRHKL